jgi:guanylate kinase
MNEPEKPRRTREGIVFVISAPSGAGKTTLLREVVKQLPGLQFSISHTTRPPRANEEPGKDYYFVSPPQFEKMMSRGEFLEWTEVSGKRYGTAKTEIRRLTARGKDLLLDVDSRGAGKVLKELKPVVLIYILPPSVRILTRRLTGRGLDSPEVVKLRLANARKEMGEARWYHYLIVNDRLDEAVERLKAVIMAERCRREKPAILRKMKILREESDGKNHRGRLSEKG